MLRIGVIVLCGVCAAGTAVAQEAPISTIDSEGVATVDAVPSYVEFWLHLQAKGGSVAEAVAKAVKFEPALRQEIQTRELAPTQLVFSSVAVPDLVAKEADISARLRFSAAPFTTTENGIAQFALLCDKIAALAGALECQPEGPTLGTEEAQSVQDTAISRAVEKAYAGGKAAAEVMSGQIIAVDHVAIGETVWNKAPGVSARQPDIRRLTCTARVQVTYAFAPNP